MTENRFNKIHEVSLWPPNVMSKTNGEYIEYYLDPKVDTIKVIDFGGAIFSEDHHSGIINTRQYRAPEVILQCCSWNEKSDIWSAGCILYELYTGDMLFPTHDSIEHLALISKLIDHFPKWMIGNSAKEFKDCFKRTDTIWTLNWPSCAPEEITLKNYEDAKPMEVFLDRK